MCRQPAWKSSRRCSTCRTLRIWFKRLTDKGALRGMTLSRSVVEMLGAVLREVASGYGVQMESFSESMSALQAEMLLNEVAPGFRIP
jgi:macrodomain Ter protein organizer (MatP/YcbG family)